MKKKNINQSRQKISAAIIGASGYTGAELARLLSKHPKVHLKFLIGEKSKGKKIGEIFSHFSHIPLPLIKGIDEIDFNELDVVFSCMPNGQLAKNILKIPNKIKIIDLSADFRFNNAKLYESYYEIHPSKNFLGKFIYGLSEINRKKIKKSNYIACPGCYPTSILLAIVPLLQSNLFNLKDIIVDSKSGISGAGRNLKENLLFTENYTSSLAYGQGNHRHRPEIEHQAFLMAQKKLNLCFTPHLIPINRGILSSIYFKGKKKVIYETLKKYYKNEQFIIVNENNISPKISDVTGTNLCKISILENFNSKYITIISVIDNLVKGASGQAVQNMNIMFDFSEELGLENQSIYP